MTRHPLLYVSVLSLTFLACINAYAQESTTTVTTQNAPQEETVTTTTTTTNDGKTSKVTETRHVIVTAVPTAKETIATPEGYINCFTIAAGWNREVWAPEHKVCQYENSPSGVVWVEGYWQCKKATTQGVCTNWEWKAARWEKTLTVY